jgi:hypothetical protein
MNHGGSKVLLGQWNSSALMALNSPRFHMNRAEIDLWESALQIHED